MKLEAEQIYPQGVPEKPGSHLKVVRDRVVENRKLSDASLPPLPNAVGRSMQELRKIEDERIAEDLSHEAVIDTDETVDQVMSEMKKMKDDVDKQAIIDKEFGITGDGLDQVLGKESETTSMLRELKEVEKQRIAEEEIQIRKNEAGDLTNRPDAAQAFVNTIDQYNEKQQSEALQKKKTEALKALQKIDNEIAGLKEALKLTGFFGKRKIKKEIIQLNAEREFLAENARVVGITDGEVAKTKVMLDPKDTTTWLQRQKNKILALGIVGALGGGAVANDQAMERAKNQPRISDIDTDHTTKVNNFKASRSTTPSVAPSFLTPKTSKHRSVGSIPSGDSRYSLAGPTESPSKSKAWAKEPGKTVPPDALTKDSRDLLEVDGDTPK